MMMMMMMMIVVVATSITSIDPIHHCVAGIKLRMMVRHIQIVVATSASYIRYFIDNKPAYNKRLKRSKVCF